MNEQDLADLFSEQLDRMLGGESTSVPSNAGEVQELLNIIGQPAAQHQFQAGSGAQAAFQSQLANWFGLLNGGSPMTILGLSKVWFISIAVAVVTVVAGAGIIVVMATSFFVFGPVSVVPASPTPEETTTDTPAEVDPEPSASVTTSPEASGTLEDETDPDDSSPAEASETPEAPQQFPPLVFVGNLQIPVLCQGAYSTQSTLVNYGDLPIDDASLVWEVIEGGDWVDAVNIDSPNLDDENDSGETTTDDPNEDQNIDPSLIVLSTDPLIVGSYSNFSPIPVEQKVKLDVKVKVKDNWWQAKHGSKIKVKLSVDQKFGDHSRFKYKYKATYKSHSPGQVITIVKQDSRWTNLTGVAHSRSNKSYVVDGVTVVTNSCTGLPITFPAGAFVNVVGWLQPNGTFLAININVININIINGDFDSGVPLPGNDDDGDGYKTDGGGGKGGSKKGGSKGGSK